MAVCKAVSASFLISQNPQYCGVLDRKNDEKKLFGRSSSRRYAIIHNGIFYLFKDSSSKEAIFAQRLSDISVLQSTEVSDCWSFTIAQHLDQHCRKITFIVGSFRELQEWMENFQMDTKYMKVKDLQRCSPDGSSAIFDLKDLKERIPDGEDAEEKYIKLYPSERKCSSMKDKMKSEPVPPIPCDSESVKPRSKSDMAISHYQNQKAITPLTRNDTTEERLQGRKLSVPPYEVMGEDELYTKMDGAVDESSSESNYSVPMEETEDEENSYENTILPKSVYQWSLDKEGANMLLRSIETDGMYLIRRGSQGLQVLTTYLEGRCRHYIIFQDGDKLFLHRDHPRFVNLFNLVNYYMENFLPTCNSKLTCPYG